MTDTRKTQHVSSAESPAKARHCLVVLRKKKFTGSLVRWTLCLDRVAVGVLASGESLALPTSPGNHWLKVVVGRNQPPHELVELPEDGHLLVRIELGAGKLNIVERRHLSDAELANLSVPMAKAGPDGLVKVVVPNRWGRILAAGIGAWLVGILGLYALGAGMEDLARINRGEVSAKGQGFIVFGMCSGVLGLLLNVALLVRGCM